MNELVLAGMSINKREHVGVNGYENISANDKAENNYYIFYLYVFLTRFKNT